MPGILKVHTGNLSEVSIILTHCIHVYWCMQNIHQIKGFSWNDTVGTECGPVPWDNRAERASLCHYLLIFPKPCKIGSGFSLIQSFFSIFMPNALDKVITFSNLIIANTSFLDTPLPPWPPVPTCYPQPHAGFQNVTSLLYSFSSIGLHIVQ